MECMVLFHADEDRALSVEIPQTVVLEVTYTEPGIKGNTATNTLKPATVETGAEVRVPLFIELGEKIVVNTPTAPTRSAQGLTAYALYVLPRLPPAGVVKKPPRFRGGFTQERLSRSLS